MSAAAAAAAVWGACVWVQCVYVLRWEAPVAVISLPFVAPLAPPLPDWWA